MNWVQRKIYLYNVTFGLYMLDWWERFLFNTLVLVLMWFIFYNGSRNLTLLYKRYISEAEVLLAATANAEVLAFPLYMPNKLPQVRFKRGLPLDGEFLFYPGEVFSSSHQPAASLRLERLLSVLQGRRSCYSGKDRLVFGSRE